MVDFNKLLEESKLKKASQALTPYRPPQADLKIQTADGQEISVSPRDLVDYMPDTGGKPLPRISAGQPRDSRFPEGSNQLFMIASERAVNEAGEVERIKEFIGPFGPTLRVRAVGYTLTRALMPKYDPAGADAPEANAALCRSENYITPDARYAGKYATACAHLDGRGKLVAACPMAQWGARDPRTGKQSPPECSETYVVAVAFEYEGNWLMAECYFRSASAAAGKVLLQHLRQLELRSLPLYTYPIDLVLKEAGIGNTFTPVMKAPGLLESSEELLPGSEDLENLEGATNRWAEALRLREERSAWMDNDQVQAASNNGNTAPAPAEEPSSADIFDGTAPDAAENEPAEQTEAPAKTKAGKGSKKNPLI